MNAPPIIHNVTTTPINDDSTRVRLPSRSIKFSGNIVPTACTAAKFLILDFLEENHKNIKFSLKTLVIIGFFMC